MLQKKIFGLTIKKFGNFPKLKFSTQILSMPIIDLDKFLHKKSGWEIECKLTAECLHDTGILVIKDPVNYLFKNKES